MHTQLANEALVIIANGPSNGTERDLWLLHKFCQEFSDGLLSGSESVTHAVRHWSKNMLKRGGDGACELVRKVIHALRSVTELMAAPADLLILAEDLIKNVLDMYRTQHKAAATG